VTGTQAMDRRPAPTRIRLRRADPITGENFPVAPRVMPGRLRRRLLALYRYARYVDDLGDEWHQDREAALKAVADDVHRLYDGDQPLLPAVAGLTEMVRACAVPADPLLRLVDANLQDQRVTRYPEFGDLLDYCRLSANPVGEVVLHVIGAATPDRVELSDRVCTGLQLLEHWQDLSEDYAKGRIYLPLDDLARFGVPEQDLGRATATEQLRALVAFETDRALAWLNAGCYLVPTLHGWGRLAVAAYIAGGRAAAEGLRRHGYDSLAGVPKPRPAEIARQWLLATVRSPG
jgi:squalene synthase HpnC